MSTLSDKFVSFWELEEASGTRIDAVVATGNDLTDNNTVTNNTGIVGNAAQFVAANVEYLSHADNASLQLGNIDFTITGWFYIDSHHVSTNTIIAKVNLAGTSFEYFIDVVSPSRKLRFVLSDGGILDAFVITSTDTISLATWYMFEAAFNASTGVGSLQINNGVADTALKVLDPGVGTGLFTLGIRNDFPTSITATDGRIDQLGLAKALFTADEKTFLYNEGNGRSWAEILAGIDVASTMHRRGRRR